MRRRRTLASLLAVGVLMIAAAVAACAEDDTETGTVGELKIGVLAPLTGELSRAGRTGAEAAELAAGQVNAAARAADLRLTLVVEDTRSDPQRAQERAAKLIESDGVSAIAGPWGTSELLPTVENVTIAAGVPVVAPAAGGPEIGALDDDDLVFRTQPSDEIQGRVLAGVMARELGAAATVTTAHADDPYGAAVVSTFTEAFEAAGGKVLRDVPYDPRAASLTAPARRIAAGRPDAWMIVDYAETWPAMGGALARTRGWRAARTFTGDALRSPGLPATAGRAATEGMRGVAPTTAAAPAAEAFERLWKREADRPREDHDAQGFDAVILLALAAAAAGSNDPAAIGASLQAVSGPPGRKLTFERLGQALAAAAAGEDIDYEGASGPIDFDERGDPSVAGYATWRYEDGALVDYGEIMSVGG